MNEIQYEKPRDKPAVVTSVEQVSENIARFQEGLLEEGLPEDENLVGRLAYFRAWYYDPSLDYVGPSKFIGYVGMNAESYFLFALDGKETEPVLARWFTVLEEGKPEYRYVRDKVWEQNASFRKHVSRAARFSAPREWKLSANQGSSAPNDIGPATANESNESLETLTDDGESAAIVEMFTRAFTTLRPSERAEVLRRLNSGNI